MTKKGTFKKTGKDYVKDLISYQDNKPYKNENLKFICELCKNYLEKDGKPICLKEIECFEPINY